MEHLHVLVRLSTRGKAIPRESGSVQLPTAVAGTWVHDCLHSALRNHTVHRSSLHLLTCVTFRERP